MQLCKSLRAMLYAALVLWFVGCMGAASAAEVSCDDWNTESFFRRAGVGDIARCLKAGARLNVRDKSWNRPLHYAAKYNGNPAVITTLVKAGADVNAKNSAMYLRKGLTPLHLAALYSKSPAVLEALIKAGADLNNWDGQWAATPWHVAALSGKTPAVVKVLIKAGADVNARFWELEMPLHLAARHKSNPAFVTDLLKAGADVNARDRDERTPLHYAARYNENLAVITALLKAGADVNARDKEYGETPLHKALGNRRILAIITALVKAGAEVNAQDSKGETPLHQAALGGGTQNQAIVEALLAVGASPMVKDVNDVTPWDYAQGNPAMIGTAAFLRLKEAVGSSRSEGERQ